MYVRSSFSLIIFIDGLLNGILIEDHSLYIVHKYILTLHKKSNTPFSYMLCLLCKKAYGELNLESALDEDTGPGDFLFFLLLFLYRAWWTCNVKVLWYMYVCPQVICRYRKVVFRWLIFLYFEYLEMWYGWSYVGYTDPGPFCSDWWSLVICCQVSSL